MRILILAAAAVFALSISATAATWEVPNDFPTIQDAIDVSSSGDFIILTGTLYGGAGNYDIDYKGKNVTIRSQAEDPATCLIDCTGGSGFTFRTGENSNARLVGVTVSNGSAPRGAGIFCINFSSPTIENCAISNNATTWNGGGVYIEQSSPYFIDCAISFNTATSTSILYGGGVCCTDNSSPRFDNCTIESNQANGSVTRGGGVACLNGGWPHFDDCDIRHNSAGYRGGGVYVYNSDPEFSFCHIENGNSSGAEGGGAYCRESDPKFYTCVINRNTAGSNGGGVCCGFDATVVLSNCNIDHNIAVSGGGVYSDYGSADITLFWGTLQSNSSTAGGGGVCCYYCSLDMENVTVTQNHTGGDGGGVKCDSLNAQSFKECTFISNVAQGNGGGIYSRWVDLYLDDCEVRLDNADGEGGGIYSTYAFPNFTNCRIQGNNANLKGGGIRFLGSTAQLNGCIIDNNESNTGSGGGMYCSWSGVQLAGCTFESNISSGAGGGLAGEMWTALTLDNCVFKTNSAINGGGMSGSGSTIHLTDCSFRSNTASGSGGGLAVSSGGMILSDIAGCEFISNTAGGDGGGMYCSSWSAPVANCSFNSNTASGSYGGGGIYCTASSPTLEDCTFFDNSAIGHGGGGVCCHSGSSPIMRRCTIQQNEATFGGGVECSTESSPELDRCVLESNVAVNYGAGLCCWPTTGPSVFRCTLYENECTGDEMERAAISIGGDTPPDPTCNILNTIIVSTVNGRAVGQIDTRTIYLECCDLYDNDCGDWVGCIAGQNGANSNFSQDPLFCAPNFGNFALDESSPCAPGNHPDECDCGFIGAEEIGCGGGATSVELVSLTARRFESRIEIHWTTQQEIKNAGFNVYRSRTEEDARIRLNDTLIPARGDELRGASYLFTDSDIACGRSCCYWLESVDIDGTVRIRGPVQASEWDGEMPAPNGFSLAQNCPNPFNPVTDIRYDLPVDCLVKLEIYDVQGRKVITLTDGYARAGRVVVAWDGKNALGADVSSGVYLYRLRAGNFTDIKKMVLVR